MDFSILIVTQIGQATTVADLGQMLKSILNVSHEILLSS